MASAPTKQKDGARTEALGDISTEEKSLGARLGGISVKYGLDLRTSKLMLKGSLPPVIAISMYQSTTISSLFPSLGYVLPIITVLAMAILPRGKYLQNLALNLVSVCVGSAVALLTLWSAVEARHHTSPPAPPGAAPPRRPQYNSSQSAVCAVWLFSNIWAVNFLRAKLPSFNLASIIYSILTSVAATYGPLLTSSEQAQGFVLQLLSAMLLALAISTGVSLLVFPTTSRAVVFQQFSGAIGLLRKSVSLQGAYLHALEQEDMFTLEPVETAVGRDSEGARRRRKKQKKAVVTPNEAKERAAAKELRVAIALLSDLASKMHVEVKFAKRDIAWGKLDAKDLGALFNLFRRVFIPVVGLSTIMDIFRRAADRRGWNPGGDIPVEDSTEKEGEKHIWNEVMKQLHEPFRILSQAINQGLEHAAVQLELIPRPKTERPSSRVPSTDTDVEAQGDVLVPGQAGFAKVVNEHVRRFHRTRSETLHVWAKERGLMESINMNGDGPSADLRERRQAQLYVLLYMEHLMHAAGEAVEDLVDFADGKVLDGTMEKNRLIFPARRRLRKWLTSIFDVGDSAAAESQDGLERGPHLVRIGDSFAQRRDPEHLPPVNLWQRSGEALRSASNLLGSEESMFGLRCACATMTIAIVCFLEQTEFFFQEQRLVWAMIMIAIGMTRTSGQSIFGLFCRVGGSLVAMILSYLIWYIPAEKTPGIVVFLGLSIFCSYYFLLKFPLFIPASIITVITQVLIIGYELQVRKIGVQAAEQTGQPYYPIYLLAPYRLATVAGGCLVAFVWTVFPKPFTDRTWLRRDLSGTLYLLANYLSAINETARAAMQDKLGDMNVSGTPANQLLRVRQTLFSKLMLLLPSLQAHSNWQLWEPTVGGRFPKEAYDEIILRSNRILNYLSLISYTVTWKPRNPAPSTDPRWLEALSGLFAQIAPSHYAILSTLTLLSNALLSGHSLPPYVPLPRPYDLTRQLLRLRNPYADEEQNEADRYTPSTPTGQTTATRILSASGVGSILDAQNMEEHGYTEFAVLQVCSTLVCDDLEGLIHAVSGLVGVVDFSFRVDVDDSSAPDLNSSGKQEGADKGKGKAD